MNIVVNLLLAIHVVVSLLIILVVLMQRPKNEGLGAAFGGGMTENLFGAQTTNVLQKFTRYLGGAFFLLTLILSMLYAKQAVVQSEIQKQLISAPKPAPAREKMVTPLVPPKPEAGTAFTPAPLSAVPLAPGGPDASATPGMTPGTSFTLQPETSATPAPASATPAATSSAKPAVTTPSSEAPKKDSKQN
jgi:preprotein translocase subunit SecG